MAEQKQKQPWPRLRDLPENEREAFAKELAGQTVPVIDGVPFAEQDAYYRWDYEKWKEKLRGVKCGPEDWD